MQVSQHGTTGSEIGDYPGALLKNSRPARPLLGGGLPASGLLSGLRRPQATTGCRGRASRRRLFLYKSGRKARATCELWLNQMAAAGTIADATVSANVSEYFLGLGKSGCLIHGRRLGRGGRSVAILARELLASGFAMA